MQSQKTSKNGPYNYWLYTIAIKLFNRNSLLKGFYFMFVQQCLPIGNRIVAAYKPIISEYQFTK